MVTSSLHHKLEHMERERVAVQDVCRSLAPLKGQVTLNLSHKRPAVFLVGISESCRAVVSETVFDQGKAAEMYSPRHQI